MSVEIRSFKIGPTADETIADERDLSQFLSGVDVERIDSAWSEDGWKILVIYKSRRQQEEREQIHLILVAALNVWRKQIATEKNVDIYEIAPDIVIDTIARYAPTTDIELKIVGSEHNWDPADLSQAIITIIRETMEDLH